MAKNPRKLPGVSKAKSAKDLAGRLVKEKISFNTSSRNLRDAIRHINREPTIAINKLPTEIVESINAMKPEAKRFHGAKIALSWFPPSSVFSPCANKFGYMSTASVRNASKLPFNVATQSLVGQLGALMADPSRNSGPDSAIPAGYTYFGQFVDHDITLDISSSLDSVTNANSINNMRTPALDLDSLYMRGPGLDPFLYDFPSSGNPTAIKFHMGTNTNTGVGGPGGATGFGGMIVQTQSDVPRVAGNNSAIIGDPRNDENLIVSQFHHSMLRFHNKVVDLHIASSFAGDIFAEAKKVTTQHYQWAVVNDYLKRICGQAAVDDALANVNAPVGSLFRMPVEFAVAAYRFGHSQIRNNYWVNFVQINSSLSDVFDFIRNPRLPVFSNWVVDFNAFFDTGFSVPVNNRAKKIDSVLAAGLTSLPGLSGAMAALATRNLRRALALGLPSGQAMASSVGITPMTTAELTQGLPVDEVAILNSSGGVLLTKTPLWYYCLREAAVLENGEQLGPVGAKIVADTFIRMLKRDAGSYLNVPGFTPFLPGTATGVDFTVADLLNFSGVTVP